MRKIPEDEIWQSEPESVVGYILSHKLKFLSSKNNYLQKEHNLYMSIFTYISLSDSTHENLLA